MPQRFCIKSCSRHLFYVRSPHECKIKSGIFLFYIYTRFPFIIRTAPHRQSNFWNDSRSLFRFFCVIVRDFPWIDVSLKYVIILISILSLPPQLDAPATTFQQISNNLDLPRFIRLYNRFQFVWLTARQFDKAGIHDSLSRERKSMEKTRFHSSFLSQFAFARRCPFSSHKRLFHVYPHYPQSRADVQFPRN